MSDPVDITDTILMFLKFLDASAPIVKQLAASTKIEFFVDDWAQANWERLVEWTLPAGFLSVLPGADIYPDSSRVSFPDKMPTHIVVAVPKHGDVLVELNGTVVRVDDDGLVVDTFGRGYDWIPPFDCVRLQSNPDLLVSIDDVRFVARPIRPEEI